MQRTILHRINLLDYNKKLIETDRFRNDLLETLGGSLYHYKNLDDIVFNSLKLIRPINKYLKNTPESIERKCGDVLEHFKMKKVLRASIKNLSTGKISTNEKEFHKSCKQRYIENILRLKLPPKFEYDRLLIEAENHLKLINENIDFYNSQKFIVEFKNNKLTPSNHNERTLLDFYFRCVDEQQEILNFIYKGGLKDRAILKSTYFLFDLPLSLIWGFNDFPYYSSSYDSHKGYFNHNLISKSAHRIGDFPIRESKKIEKIYDINKGKFYNSFFKRFPIKQILDEIHYNINYLPITNDRKLILEELIFLFSKKRWISFYGLALSQIEGLFSEMIDFTYQKKNMKSLPNKVNSIRNYYILSKSYFDYFEYHIPELRNRFMHGVLNGDEKDKLNSYDLLVDIHFLLDLTKTLDSEYISINNIIKKNEAEISSLTDVAMLFDLYEKLSPKQKEDVNIGFQNFVKENLFENENLKFMVLLTSEKLREKITDMKNNIVEFFNQEIKFEKTNYKSFNEYLNNNEKIEKLKDEFIFYQDELLQIMSYNTFLKLYKKKTYNLPNDLKEVIGKTFDAFKDDINKISLIGEKLI